MHNKSVRVVLLRAPGDPAAYVHSWGTTTNSRAVVLLT